jgi:hypothetical protein
VAARDPREHVRPARRDDVGHAPGGGLQRLGERLRERTLGQVHRRHLLPGATERVGREEHLLEGPDGQQTVAVHGLEPDIEVRAGGRDHRGQEEAGKIVGDDDRRLIGQRGEQPAALASRGFQIRVVGDSRPLSAAWLSRMPSRTNWWKRREAHG